jgi:hypothetical protein
MQLREAGFTAISVTSVCYALNLGATSFKSAGAWAATTGALTFSSASYEAVKNIGVAVMTINRTGGSSGPASAICTTINNTAIAGLQLPRSRKSSRTPASARKIMSLDAKGMAPSHRPRPLNSDFPIRKTRHEDFCAR